MCSFDRKTKELTSRLSDYLPADIRHTEHHRHIQEHYASTPLANHDECCAYFVQHEDDVDPKHWEPRPEQFKLDLVQISSIDDAHIVRDNVTGAPLPSFAYLAFPKTKKAPFDISNFGANQYNLHLRVAAEVLTGPTADSCVPRLVSFVPSERAKTRRPHWVYGALGEFQTKWNSLHPHPLNATALEWKMNQKRLANDQLALILPNFYPTSSDDRLIVTVEPNFDKIEENRYEKIVQSVIASAFGADIKDLRHVLLYPGSFVLERHLSEELHEPAGYPIPVRPEELKERHDIYLHQIFQQFIANCQEPFAFLHPVWNDDVNRLWAGWQDVGSSQRLSIPMPGLNTLLKDFQREMVKFSKTKDGKPRYRPNEHCLTITPADKSTASNLMDFPTYVVTPGMTEREWFRVRLHITAPSNVVNVVWKKDIDWRSKIAKSNVWGPRYGVERASPTQPPQPTSVSFDEATVREDSERTKQTLPKTPVTDTFRSRNPHATRTMPAPKSSQPHKPDPINRSDRERTWATQPSIFDTASPRIPINAPPSQHMLRTTSSVPMVSKAINTPTEQARLERDLWDIRNIVLARTAQCPFKGCDFVYRLDDRVRIEHHVEYEHLAKQCMWCDEPMYNWWSQEQKTRHLKDKHAAKLREALGVKGTTTGGNTRKNVTATKTRDRVLVPIHTRPVRRPIKARTDEEAERGWFRPGPDSPRPQTLGPRTPDPDALYPYPPGYRFVSVIVDANHPNRATRYCNRCGLHQRAARTDKEWDWHDHVCTDGNAPDFRTVDTLCSPCRGKADKGLLVDKVKDRVLTRQSQCWGCGGEPRHCTKCAFDLDTLTTPEERLAHGKTCRGYGRRKWKYCEWCGIIPGHPSSLDKLSEHRYCMRMREKAPDISRPRRVDKEEVDVLLDYIDEILYYSANEDVVAGTRRRLTRKRLRPRCEPEVEEEEQEEMDVDEKEEEAEEEQEAEETMEAKSEVEEEDEEEEAEEEEVEEAEEDEDEEGEGEEEAEEEDIDYVSEVSSSDVPLRVTRGRTRSPRPSIETAKMTSTPSPAAAAASPSNSDSEEASPRRRSPSPDWDEQLGPGEDDFEPDEDMYCSKCLRKAPKHRDRSPGRSPLGREREMEYHADPERCCRIRNGLGSALNLPNRSGWIPMADLPKRIGQVKQKFLRKYPGYDQVLYPIHKNDHHSSLWRSDPNNETNRAFWDMPWPPYEGLPPFPGNWEHPDMPSHDNVSAKKRRAGAKAKAVRDPAYRYQSDEDSADGLQPDVDDLAEGGKKRRRGQEGEEEGVTTIVKEVDGAVGGGTGRGAKKARMTPTPEEGGKRKKGKGVAK